MASSDEARDAAATHVEANDNGTASSASKIVRLYSHPWTQILLISFICFCLPGVSFLRYIYTQWQLITILA